MTIRGSTTTRLRYIAHSRAALHYILIILDFACYLYLYFLEAREALEASRTALIF